MPISAAREQYAALVEVWVRDVRGKLLYHNSWVTNLEVTAQTVAAIARIGRSRWKIENEQFNVHKNGGYELEHNSGHGKNGLAFVLYVLNLLAFVTHQILEMGDRLYQQAREADTLKELWNGLRMLMRKMVFETWKGMLEFWLDDSLPAKT